MSVPSYTGDIAYDHCKTTKINISVSRHLFVETLNEFIRSSQCNFWPLSYMRVLIFQSPQNCEHRRKLKILNKSANFLLLL
jgi:hypothetical protein